MTIFYIILSIIVIVYIPKVPYFCNQIAKINTDNLYK